LADFLVAYPSEVSVTFRVEVRNNEFVTEPDSAGLELPVRSLRRVRGQVEICSGDIPPVRPEDELVPLVKNLCYRAVSTLIEKRHAVVGYTDSYGYLRADLEGDLARLSGDGVPDVRVLAAPFAVAAVDCGSRFRRWLRRCELDGDIEAIDAGLAEAEAEARRALPAYARLQ
jgi:hypothetical protein